MDSLYQTAADASVLTLAVVLVFTLVIAFGLRGWVADLFARIRWLLRGGPGVGALVEIDGYIGSVIRVGLTRISLRGSDGSQTWIPLSAIQAVSVYPKNHQTCLVDIIFPPGNDQAKLIEGMVVTRTETMRERFPNIMREPPRLLGRRETNAGQNYIRVYFPIWPGCGEVIEDVFRPQIGDALRKLDPDYADWMIVVTYDTSNDS